MIRFIGIDPGDVWCGFAMLEYDPVGLGDQYFLTEARVFHAPSRENILRTVQDILFGLPAVVVAENYQVRPTGYNRFNAGTTLRLLGALELTTHQSLASSWNMVPPAAWEKNLTMLTGDGNMFKRWAPDWHQYNARRADWGHAKSAWRVLMMYLMQHHPGVLQVLRDPDCTKQYKRIRSVLYSAEKRVRPKDLSAPAATWLIPRPYHRSLSYLVTSARRDL